MSGNKLLVRSESDKGCDEGAVREHEITRAHKECP